MSTKYKGTEQEVRALDTFIKLTRAAESMGSRIGGVLADSGLTESQFGTLEAVYHLGPMCQGKVAAKLLKSSGNMTMVIDNLEKRGLVRRERDPDDRRQIIVHLTEAGAQLIADIFPAHVAAIVDEMRVLTPAEQEELGRLCKILGLQARS